MGQAIAGDPQRIVIEQIVAADVEAVDGRFGVVRARAAQRSHSLVGAGQRSQRQIRQRRAGQERSLVDIDPASAQGRAQSGCDQNV